MEQKKRGRPRVRQGMKQVLIWLPKSVIDRRRTLHISWRQLVDYSVTGLSRLSKEELNVIKTKHV